MTSVTRDHMYFVQLSKICIQVNNCLFQPLQRYLTWAIKINNSDEEPEQISYSCNEMLIIAFAYIKFYQRYILNLISFWFYSKFYDKILTKISHIT